ncbi:MAG: grasp-with-spasm system ATP-grasp peptide maturase [Cyanothece sp. SIO1E1]|nr:grasp-with-spasm system ATP-grasp peptide maturase [Cyanothece sp. SIO1E1]
MKTSKGIVELDSVKKKHLILTTAFDPSCDEVMDWMRYHDGKAEISRINAEDLKTRVFKNQHGRLFEWHSEGTPTISQYHSIWYRKQAVFFERRALSKGLFEDVCLTNSSIDLLHYSNLADLNALLDYECIKHQSSKKLGQGPNEYFSKLLCLGIATRSGLSIPRTLVTGNKASLTEFLHTNLPQGIVCKAITDGISIHQDEEKICLANYTEQVTEETLDRLPAFFQASLFQQMIDKAFEVRTFFLNEEFYSMAIFSQSNPQTAVDYRHYDYERPVRTAKFTLPAETKQSLLKLVRELDLYTGSIDLIKSTDGKFYFLEVNPSGQFSAVSKSCGYHLEERVAKFLTEEKDELSKDQNSHGEVTSNLPSSAENKPRFKVPGSRDSKS